MRARVTVTLKSGVLDPQGKAIEGALGSLGIEGVSGVRQGKIFDLTVAAETEQAAHEMLERACERLLANTVIENYRVEIEEEAAARPAAPVPTVPGEGAFAPDTSVAEPEAAEMPAEGHP